MSVVWVVQDHSVAGEPGELSAVRKSEVTETPIYTTAGEFKEVFQVLYQLRAEREGIESYCSRCGSSVERKGQGAHHSFCRVPSEERKALLEAVA